MRVAAVVMLAVLLVGCDALPVPRGEPPTAQAPAEESVPEEPVVEPARPEAEAGREPEKPPKPRPLPPLPAPRPSYPDVTPEKLTGMTPSEAELLLGPPDLRSEEPPAVVWTYIVGSCRLELFFYYDLESQQQRTLTFDLAPGHKAEGAEAFCFTLLGRRGEESRRLETVEEQLPGGKDAAPRQKQEEAIGE